MASIGWSPKRIEHEISHSHYDDGRSKGYVGHVNPMDFLHATTRDDAHLKTIFDEAGNLNFKKLTKETQSPFLEFEDGKIFGHEGRHRMAALAKNGYTKVPVMVKPYWSSGKNLAPVDQVNFEPQFEGRNPVTINNLIPLNKNYKNQIDDMMAEHPEHFQDGGPITAYHGSPHDFEQFDTSKIGTGEGAQAYGHGLYFAEHEPVAEGYRNRLAGHIPGAVKIGDETHPHWARKDVAKAFAKLGYDPQTSVIAAHQIDEHKGDLDKASAELWENENVPNSVHDALHKAEYATPAGHMYEVAIDAHPDHMLDWDKPLSANTPQAIKDSFNNIANNNPVLKEKFHAAFRQQLPGSIYYSILSDHAKTGDIVKNQKFASDLLSQHGIHGIRYLDQGSRGVGQGTHNYVVFDHNRVTVKRKYEQGGAVDNNQNITKAKGGTIDREKVDYKQMPHSPIVKHVLDKISAPLPALDPHLLAAIAGRRS